MLNNNFKNLAKQALHYNNSSTYVVNNMTDISGNQASYTPYGSNSLKLDYKFGGGTLENIIGNSEYNASLFIGTGQREESQDDIALESIIPDSELTINNATSTFSESESKFFFTKTFTYIGTEDVTINEVAFYKKIINSYAGKGYVCCLARQKIEPLTVKTGDVFTMTMVIG